MANKQMKKLLASEATWNPSSFRKALPHLFTEYWTTEPAFSESKLTEIRSTPPMVNEPRYPYTAWFSENILNQEPADPTAALQCGFGNIHPLFQPGNFLTSLPMNEVLDQIRPALRLATMFVTNERALQWFAHVRFSEPTDCHAGNKMLIRPKGEFRKEQMDVVQKELVALADKVKFTWVGGESHLDLNGVTCPTVPATISQLYAGIFNKPLDTLTYSEMCLADLEWSPMVLLNICHFHKALQHAHHGASRVQQEFNQFGLARVIVHEFAHVWMGFCHRATRYGTEPLAFPCDAIPEAGFSWEQFIFGASLGTSEIEENVLSVRTFAGQFREPLHYLCSYIPQTYVSQWFLQSTWDNFAHLHESGALYAPSPDRQTKHFWLRRFCKASKSTKNVLYINGYVCRAQDCDDPDCTCKSNPGRSEPWPSKPEDLFRAYMKVMQDDKEIAIAMGVDLDADAMNAFLNERWGYDDLALAMDKADNPLGLPIEWPEPAAPPLCPLPQHASKCVCM